MTPAQWKKKFNQGAVPKGIVHHKKQLIPRDFIYIPREPVKAGEDGSAAGGEDGGEDGREDRGGDGGGGGGVDGGGGGGVDGGGGGGVDGGGGGGGDGGGGGGGDADEGDERVDGGGDAEEGSRDDNGSNDQARKYIPDKPRKFYSGIVRHQHRGHGESKTWDVEKYWLDPRGAVSDYRTRAFLPKKPTWNVENYQPEMHRHDNRDFDQSKHHEHRNQDMSDETDSLTDDQKEFMREVAGMLTSYWDFTRDAFNKGRGAYTVYASKGTLNDEAALISGYQAIKKFQLEFFKIFLSVNQADGEGYGKKLLEHIIFQNSKDLFSIKPDQQSGIVTPMSDVNSSGRLATKSQYFEPTARKNLARMGYKTWTSPAPITDKRCGARPLLLHIA